MRIRKAMINVRGNAPSFGDIEWFCCLLCRQPPQNAGVAYYVSECGHIICSNCRTNAKADECGECKKQKPQYKQLIENFATDPKIGVYFSKVSGMAQKIVKLLEFQAYHMRKSSLLPGSRVIDIPTSFNFLNNVDTYKLQEMWRTEMKYISNLKYQFQQLMGMMKFISKAGVSLVDTMSLEVKYEGRVCFPADLIINIRPKHYGTGKNNMSMMSDNRSSRSSRSSSCSLPPPPPPHCPRFGNGSTPTYFGDSGYSNNSVGLSQVSESLHLKNRITPTLSMSCTSPFITPKGRSTRLSVMPPPSNGKLGF